MNLARARVLVLLTRGDEHVTRQTETGQGAVLAEETQANPRTQIARGSPGWGRNTRWAFAVGVKRERHVRENPQAIPK